MLQGFRAGLASAMGGGDWGGGNFGGPGSMDPQMQMMMQQSANMMMLQQMMQMLFSMMSGQVGLNPMAMGQNGGGFGPRAMGGNFPSMNAPQHFSHHLHQNFGQNQSPSFNGNVDPISQTSVSDPGAAQSWNHATNANGALKFNAGMNIDTDGKGSSHGDRWHQNQTSMRLADGSSLNADNTPYMVLPPQLAKQYGVKPGDLALVRHGDKVSPAIFGDVGPRNKLGEGSTRLAANLGINTDPNRGGTDKGVQYVVFPGSGRGVHNTDQNTTTQALWDRINALQH